MRRFEKNEIIARQPKKKRAVPFKRVKPLSPENGEPRALVIFSKSPSAELSGPDARHYLRRALNLEINGNRSIEADETKIELRKAQHSPVETEFIVLDDGAYRTSVSEKQFGRIKEFLAALTPSAKPKKNGLNG